MRFCGGDLLPDGMLIVTLAGLASSVLSSVNQCVIIVIYGGWRQRAGAFTLTYRILIY